MGKEGKRERRGSLDDFFKALLLSYRVLKNMSNRLSGYNNVRVEQSTILFNSDELELVPENYHQQWENWGKRRNLCVFGSAIFLAHFSSPLE